MTNEVIMIIQRVRFRFSENSIEKFFKGTGDLSDVLSGLKQVLPDVNKALSDVVKTVKDIPNTSGFKNEIMPDNNLKGLGESIKSGFDSSVDRLIDVLGIQSPAGGLAQNMTVNNNVTIQPVKVDVNGDINLKDNKVSTSKIYTKAHAPKNTLQ